VQRSLFVAVSAPLLAGAALAAAALGWADRFPAGVASHIGPDGRIDGVAATGSFAATGLAVCAGLALLWALLVRSVRRNPAGLRLLSAASSGSAAVVAAGGVALLVTSLDRTDLLGRSAPGWVLPLTLAALAGGSALGWFLGRSPAPARTPQPPPAEAPRIDLPVGGRAVWTHVVVAVPIAVGALVAAGLGVALTVTAGAAAGAPALLVAAALAVGTSARVTVDATGLTAHPGPVRRPRLHVPLDRVVSARRTDVRATEMGGWGVRMRGERTALLLRSGEALELDLADGSRFLVTVDDAATAAALVNTLAERARRC